MQRRYLRKERPGWEWWKKVGVGGAAAVVKKIVV
jgi:hypothetical protein